MNFVHSSWLLMGLGICICLLAYFLLQAGKRASNLKRFVAAGLLSRLTENISVVKRRIKITLLLLSILLCFIALARPQYGEQWMEVKHKGIDILIALDTSKSMLAEDTKPNRLERAKLAITDFTEKLDGDRIGLMPFAGTAYLMCPLTIDYDAFLQSLSATNTDIVPVGGTNIAAVIEKALEVLDNEANHKILVIITDGEDLEGKAIKAAETAAQKGLTIFTVGVGTSKGELIPIKHGSGQEFVKDKDGNFVRSHLDTKTLTEIAEKSGGLFTPLGSAGEGLNSIYRKKLALIPKEELSTNRRKMPIERSEWPIALALVLLSLEFMTGERKTAFTLPKLSFIRTFLAKMIRRKPGKGLALILLFLLLGRYDGFASTGEDAYSRGDYVKSSEYYRKRLENHPEDSKLWFNYGTASYKNNMYDDAIDAFSKALKSNNPDVQENAYYNRGNSYYRKGQVLQQSNAKETTAQWQQAIASYEAALKLNPNDKEAQANHDAVKKELATLEKSLKTEKEQPQPQEKQQAEKEGSKDDKKQDQQNADQDKSGKTKDNSDKTEQKPQQGQDNEQEQDGAQKESAKEQQKAVETKHPAENEKAEQELQAKKEENAKEMLRRNQGKMTRTEAEQLLNALKQEETNLHLVPSDHNRDKPIEKDW